MNIYERHSIVPIEEVHPHIGSREKKVLFNGVLAKVVSLRLRTFAINGYVCSCCGLKATHFALERNHVAQESGYHLNLYGVNEQGEDILFTHDHTVARALGGPDNITNTTTMCYLCNHRKGVQEAELVRQQRFTLVES